QQLRPALRTCPTERAPLPVVRGWERLAWSCSGPSRAQPHVHASDRGVGVDRRAWCRVYRVVPLEPLRRDALEAVRSGEIAPSGAEVRPLALQGGLLEAEDVGGRVRLVVLEPLGGHLDVLVYPTLQRRERGHGREFRRPAVRGP